MGTMTMTSKSSTVGYTYTDENDTNLTCNGNYEIDEQTKNLLTASGNIYYLGSSIASFSTQRMNGTIQYQLYGMTSENIGNAYKALSGVQEQIKANIAAASESEEKSETTDTASETTTETAEEGTDDATASEGTSETETAATGATDTSTDTASETNEETSESK